MDARDAQRGLRPLETSVEESGGHARFVIATDDPLAHDRLVHMGCLPISNERFATRWFPRSANARRYYDRFAASIEQMVLQSARLVPVPWEEALREFLRRVESTDLHWWLYGSAALALRGLPVEPGDIDIYVNDAIRTGRIFDDLLVTPVERMNGWVAVYRAVRSVTRPWSGSPNPTPNTTLAQRRTNRVRSSRTKSKRCSGASTSSQCLRCPLSFASARGAD